MILLLRGSKDVCLRFRGGKNCLLGYVRRFQVLVGSKFEDIYS